MGESMMDKYTTAYDDLKEALKYVLQDLDSGKRITLDIKGYASPLSSAAYNKKLTLRRINSVRNELSHFHGSDLDPYLQSGQLKIRVFPYGEDEAAVGVSDDANDRRNAVYSKKAAFERRVEIIAVDIQ